jgi:hypothetical protein
MAMLHRFVEGEDDGRNGRSFEPLPGYPTILLAP